MVRRSCELCESPAKMYCDSDQAYLCWGCDFKVHSANFLVARHSRTCLCQRCQSPTPWSAAGPKLCPTITLCEKCFGEDAEEERESVDSDVAIDGGDELDLDEDEAVEAQEDEGENQVVPWSSSPPMSPPETSSSSSEDEFSDLPSLKRNRYSSSDLGFQEIENISRSIRRRENDPAVVTSENDNRHLEKGTTMPSKEIMIPEPALDRNVQGRTGLIKESVETIEREIAPDLSDPAGINGLCELGRNHGAV